jgi:hypothetical protein
MSDKLNQIIKTALIAGYKPKPIPMRTESIENVIRKALFEQGIPLISTYKNPLSKKSQLDTWKDSLGPAKFGQMMKDIETAKETGTFTTKDIDAILRSYDPNYAPSKTAPYALGFGPGEQNYFQTQVKNVRQKLEPFHLRMDYPSLQKEVGVVAGMMPPWMDRTAYNKLLSLGGAPFLGQTGTKLGPSKDVTPLQPEDAERIVKGEEPYGTLLTGVQIKMYNHPENPNGMFVYFFETPNRMYFPMEMYGANYYVDWKLETVEATTTLWLMRGDRKEGWITKRNPSSDEVIFVDRNDVGIKDPLGSGLIQSLRAYSGFPSLFKNNYKKDDVVVNFGIGSMNLSALADRIQMAFDWIGILVPPIDIVNAIWYAVRERYLEAFISIVALYPGVGDAIAIAFRPVIALARNLKLGAQATYKLLCETMEKNGISFTALQEVFPKATEWVAAAQKSGMLTQQQADDMIVWINDFKQYAAIWWKNRSADAVAKNKALQARINKKLGLQTVDTAPAQEQVGFWRNLGRRLSKFFGGLTSPRGIIDTILRAGKGTIRITTSWLVKRSGKYWRSAYIMAYNQFIKLLMNDPQKVAMCILSFTEKNISKKWITKVADELWNLYPKRRTFDRNRNTYVEFIPNYFGQSLTKEQFLRKVANNLPQALDDLLTKSASTFKRIVSEMVKDAAVASSKTVNVYWTAFWADPLRRFANEYGGRSIKTVLPVSSGNTIDDVSDWFVNQFSSQDFLRKVDVFYNEFQEAYERFDYGTEEGSKLNQQSVIYAIVDYVVSVVDPLDRNIAELIEVADEAAKDLSPTYEYVSNLTDESYMPGKLDSLNFQIYSGKNIGEQKYKTANLKKFVDSGDMEYLGSGKYLVRKVNKLNQLSMSSVKNPSKKGITPNGTMYILQVGDILYIDPKGIISKI